LSDKKISFTKAMREQLIQQEDFYASLDGPVNAAGVQFLIRNQDVRNGDATVSEKPLGNGDVRARVSFPMDDNKNPADGWLQLTDSFLLSGDGRRVLAFDRQFKPNAQATSELWQRRLNLFRSAALPSLASQQEFSDHVLTKPLVFERLKQSPQALQFMLESGAAIQQGLGDDQMQILPKEHDSCATVEKLGNGYRIKFTWVFDNDADGKNGRYIMADDFIIDSDKKFKSHSRQWKVHPDAVSSVGSLPPVKLYGVGKPSKDLAEAFVDAIVPAFFSVSQPTVVAATEPRREPVRIDPPAEPQPNVGIGQVSVVPGPRVRMLPSESKKAGSNGPAYEFSFSQHANLDRNLTTENASGQMTRMVGPNLRSQLSRRGIAGSAKFNFLIRFEKETGYVKNVVAALVQDDGLQLNGSSDLQNILREAAKRIHLNLRAHDGLASKELSAPITAVIQ
jgi:hypothetical protein